MSNIYGRQVVIPLVNKSGGSVIKGDCVIIDTGNDGAFTTTTSGQYQGSLGVAQETIASNATGRVLVHGYADLVTVPSSMTRGRFLETHTVAKQATGSATRRAGSFGQFLTGGATPTAWLWGFPDNAGAAGETVATSTIWDAAGDILVGTAADTGARLAVGADSTVLTVSPSTHVPVWSAPGATALSYQQAFLSGDVSMTTANTFYDGPAVTLSAGTWLLSTECLLLDPTGVGGIVSWKIWDGTTVASNDQRSKAAGAEWLPLWTGPVVVVIASGTPSWKISFAFSNTPTSWLIKAAGGSNISGNLASHITAVKIA